MGASASVTHDGLAGSKRGQAIDNAERPQGTADFPDPVRRALLTSLLAASAASVIPPAFAAPPADAAQSAFLSASQTLTGQSSLDPEEASRLYNALIADDPRFADGVQALAKILGQSIGGQGERLHEFFPQLLPRMDRRKVPHAGHPL